MDLAYLRAHPGHLPTFLLHQRIRETPVTGGDTCVASRLTLDDGSSVFVKTWPEKSDRTRPDGFFVAEADGLCWLADSGAPTPGLIAGLPQLLALDWIEPGPPTAESAARLGHDLAAMHRFGAPSFGAAWPGWIGRLALDNTPSPGPWSVWFAERRLLPYLRASVDAGALTDADARLVEEAAGRLGALGGDESPSRLHGDLWPGNILWAADGTARLVDPAAHGGHRETDLANLALFGGAPHLDRLLAAYQEAHPLAAGWQARRPAHQLHLLLVHTAQFGGGHRDAVVAAASAALRG
ncbi:fructosamine kinase family protein [Pilimelia columellifera]|uniref:Fructosamine kinase family protein n=1 Tax=Pilimelia columellifera subsp. columellifera TaxID=706583 RepID=A0ABN3MZI7_9ACTN